MNNIEIMELNTNIGSIKSFWCHICKSNFNKFYIEESDIQCINCNNNFCEEVLNDNINDEQHPSNFQPYECTVLPANRTNNNPFNVFQIPRANRPRNTSNLLDMILGILGHENTNDQSMEDIINYIMVNDTNRYGNPPTAKKTLESLEKIVVNSKNKNILCSDNDNSCSVCKEVYEDEQILVNLPCKHLFHEECIIPWLKDRNSCPTCRFELPTDDLDFEARKRS